MKGFFEILSLLHGAHTFSAAARRGFDQHRVADALCLFLQESRILRLAMIPGDQGNARVLHDRLGLTLRSHGANGAGGRADEDQTGSAACLGKSCVLRQKPIAGMNGLRPRLAGCVYDGLDVQIALRR